MCMLVCVCTGVTGDLKSTLEMNKWVLDLTLSAGENGYTWYNVYSRIIPTQHRVVLGVDWGGGEST